MTRNTVPITRNARAVALATSMVALSTLVGCETIRGWFGGGSNESSKPAPVEPTQSNANQRPVERMTVRMPSMATSQETSRSEIGVPAALQPMNRPVLTGHAPEAFPLVYLVDQAGPIRVSNMDTGEEIVTVSALSGQIVRVDAKGVYLGSQQKLGATLAPGTYGIIVMPQGSVGVVDTKVTRSTPIMQPPAAATSEPAMAPMRPPTSPPETPPAATSTPPPQ